ncbi:hypothetical protein MHI39_20285 [Heyndrickxia sp. FSL K6-6286]
MKKLVAGLLVAGVLVGLSVTKEKPNESSENVKPLSSPGNGGIGGNATG